jgi:hypothetical protein
MKRQTILAILVFLMVFGSFALVKSDSAGPPDGLDVHVKNTPLPVEGIVSVGYCLVGVSDTIVRADQGFSGLYAACQATYGPLARMCTVEEAMLDPAISALPEEFWNGAPYARVHPTDVDYSWIVDPQLDPSFSQVRQFARSAKVGGIFTYNIGVADQATVDCYGWTSHSGMHSGAVLEASGRFGTRSCVEDTHVLCCAPKQ